MRVELVGLHIYMGRGIYIYKNIYIDCQLNVGRISLFLKYAGCMCIHAIQYVASRRIMVRVYFVQNITVRVCI